MIFLSKLQSIRQRDPEVADALKQLASGVNSVATQANVGINNPLETPTAPDKLEVSAQDGFFEIAITDTSTDRRRGLAYFVEYDTDSTFKNARGTNLGPSRNWRVQLGNLTLYWRAYCAYPSSDPSPYVYAGGITPASVVGGGTATGPTLLPTQGSGTSTNPGAGFGYSPTRGTKTIQQDLGL